MSDLKFTIGGDLADIKRALAELRDRAGPHERYLPYAVGDGHPHTLHLCATSGFASVLEPDPRQLDLLVDFPALARVIATFGAAHPHHAYVFANQRANRLKILVHDGVGLWGRRPCMRCSSRSLGVPCPSAKRSPP